MSTDETERTAVLDELQLLDSPREERFDRVVRLAQHIFGVPFAGVNLISDDRHYTKAAAGGGHGFPEPSSSLPLSDSLCAITVQDDRTLEIPDLRGDEAWADHPVAQGGTVGYYAGAPLRAPGGQRIGSLCLMDVVPRRELSVGEHAMLRDLAGWLERELAASADLQQGAELQRRLLPRGMPDLPGWDVAGRCVQAGAVGGDFYDWQLLPRLGQVQVLLADVMGKGIQAALVASGVRAIIRGTSPHNTLTASMRRVADDMEADLGEISSFVTMFVARFDPSDGAAEYVDAGHGLAFVVGPDRSVRLSSDGLPVGALPGERWDPRDERIGPGEALVIVSDGMLDVHGDADGVLTAARAALEKTSNADELVELLLAGAVGHLTTDDVTVVVARRSAG
ncbi:MAG TPA: SpoIIE family protein phosphatase [Nocardioides sp.]|nr:SpoIIE family protein phosphatase [Nocardioides sp.]